MKKTFKKIFSTNQGVIYLCFALIAGLIGTNFNHELESSGWEFGFLHVSNRFYDTEIVPFEVSLNLRGMHEHYVKFKQTSDDTIKLYIIRSNTQGLVQNTILGDRYLGKNLKGVNQETITTEFPIILSNLPKTYASLLITDLKIEFFKRKNLDTAIFLNELTSSKKLDSEFDEACSAGVIITPFDSFSKSRIMKATLEIQANPKFRTGTKEDIIVYNNVLNSKSYSEAKYHVSSFPVVKDQSTFMLTISKTIAKYLS